MPDPVRSGQRYMPGLDGLRALAVGAVVAYHLGFGWAPGGLLGVGVFFTLSGYLITDLLLGELRRPAHAARGFLAAPRPAAAAGPVRDAGRRGRLGYAAGQPAVAALRGAVGASMVYVTNWWLISQHLSYFARFGPPSPLNHLWSLAVEEQFYIIWPWLLWLGLRWRRGRPGSALRLAAADAPARRGLGHEMALLFQPGYDPSRIYYGTDTRAFALLVGAALALVWPSRGCAATPLAARGGSSTARVPPAWRSSSCWCGAPMSTRPFSTAAGWSCSRWRPC